MSDKTVEQLLQEQNDLIRQQNELLRQSNATAIGVSASQHAEEIKARERRNTPWWAKPPTWAR
jgi:hypothetical protein